MDQQQDGEQLPLKPKAVRSAFPSPDVLLQFVSEPWLASTAGSAEPEQAARAICAAYKLRTEGQPAAEDDVALQHTAQASLAEADGGSTDLQLSQALQALGRLTGDEYVEGALKKEASKLSHALEIQTGARLAFASCLKLLCG